jgi:hypothetical protein
MPERRTAAQATIDETTDQTSKQNADSEPEIELQKKKSLLDLSLAQVLGGALAAMTAAALGSRLSVVGTVVGAALASVIAAVSGALYTASLRRTRETVRAVIGGRSTAGAPIPSRAGLPQPVTGVSAVAADPGLQSAASTQDRSASSSRLRALVVTSLVGAMATFALAAGALTMYEALSGHAMSGGRGTTLSQIQHHGLNDRPTDKHTPAASKSADPSHTAQPSAEPSGTPDAQASPTAEPSGESTVQPSAEPSVTPDADPSDPAVPSSAPGSQTAQGH